MANRALVFVACPVPPADESGVAEWHSMPWRGRTQRQFLFLADPGL